MKFKPPMFTRAQICKRGKLAFTLAEVLAALVFMAIVIPVAVEGLRVASRAGQFGQRKATATRIAEKVINELLVSGQLQTGGQTGTSQEGGTQYRWSIRSQAWSEDTMSQVTVLVTFPMQGTDYEVRLTTLLDPNATTQ
jgi:type II secretory pathway pseudopilin PulG